MEIIAEAADGMEAIRRAHEQLPDAAVIDISMPNWDGLEVVGRLHDEYPELPILILTMHEEGQYVVRAMEAGAMGYITKQSASRTTRFHPVRNNLTPKSKIGELTRALEP